ncbi:Phosphatidylglycerophosphate phosphatase PTPMT1-like protein [Drosera capensis]
MYIEELKEEGELKVGEEAGKVIEGFGDSVVVYDAKRVLVGAGARALFYPTLFYNVVRNKFQPEFRWWDRVDEFLLLGAVPFLTDVPRLKEIGVGGVVTLNEPYETLVPTTLYEAHDIKHLVIPTRDYLFAPSLADISKAVEFIHANETCGKTTYVHCKAGRGRSTTIVLCYLVQYKQMTPDSAYDYVRSIRPRVLLASSQWQAVQNYYTVKVKNPVSSSCMMAPRSPSEILSLPSTKVDVTLFDDGSMVIITESDLAGYSGSEDLCFAGNKSLPESGMSCKVQFSRKSAISRLSKLWLRNLPGHKGSKKELSRSMGAEQIGSISIDIQVY